MSTRQVGYGALYIDMTWRDALELWKLALGPPKHSHTAMAKLQEYYSSQQLLVTLSVRTALDAYLNTAHFAQGTEVLISAITIPDITRIILHHGLVPVPFDLDLETLGPDLASFRSRVTSQTRLVIFAHIYGRINDLSTLIEECASLSLPFIEDCAEAFTPGYRGHPRADLCLFSFGAIKQATAFGGGIALIKHPEVYTAMKRHLDALPMRSQSSLLFRLLKYSIVMFFLNTPRVTGAAITLLKLLGIDYHGLLVSLIRGFPDPKVFFSALRQRPSHALVEFLAHRIVSYSPADTDASCRVGDHVVTALAGMEDKVLIPGKHAGTRNYWLFPLVVGDPALVCQELQEHGIDAYRGATQLALVEHGVDSPVSRFILEHVLYVPVHKRVDDATLAYLSKTLKQVLGTTRSSL